MLSLGGATRRAAKAFNSIWSLCAAFLARQKLLRLKKVGTVKNVADLNTKNFSVARRRIYLACADYQTRRRYKQQA